MLLQIFSFVLDIVFGLLTSICLLRLYMQIERVPFGNPVGRLVFAFSDWLVLPLRRVVPAARRWDPSCLVAALLLQAAQYLLLWLLMAGSVPMAWVAWMAVFSVLRVALSAMMGLLIVYAVLSWVQTRSPIADVITRLAEPLLRPLRRIIPIIGGIDLSVLVALVLLQVAMMVLGQLQMGMP